MKSVGKHLVSQMTTWRRMAWSARTRYRTRKVVFTYKMCETIMTTAITPKTMKTFLNRSPFVKSCVLELPSDRARYMTMSRTTWTAVSLPLVAGHRDGQIYGTLATWSIAHDMRPLVPPLRDTPALPYSHIHGKATKPFSQGTCIADVRDVKAANSGQKPHI